MKPGALIIDVGSYRGEWALRAIQQFHCVMYAFEPVYPEITEEALATEEAVRVFPVALGAETGETLMSVDGDASSTKVGQRNYSVHVLGVEDFFRESNVQQVALMKINIEGGEYDLIDKMLETRLVERIERLLVQFHEFIDHAVERYECIRSGLEETHSLVRRVPFAWESWVRHGTVS